MVAPNLMMPSTGLGFAPGIFGSPAIGGMPSADQQMQMMAAMAVGQFLQSLVEQAVMQMAWQQFMGQMAQALAPQMQQRGAQRGLRAQDFAGFQDPRTAKLAKQKGGGGSGGGGSGGVTAANGAAPNLGPANQGSAALMVKRALEQNGDRYVFGHEVNLDDKNPNTFDCSELVQWAVHQAGGSIPDGSQNQRAWVRQHGKTLSIEEAIRTPGALLFTDGHVAISLGDGRTIEAMGSKYGVKIGNARGRGWKEAGLVPGLQY